MVCFLAGYRGIINDFSEAPFPLWKWIFSLAPEAKKKLEISGWLPATTPSRLRTVIVSTIAVLFWRYQNPESSLVPPLLQLSAIAMTLRCKPCDTRQGMHPHCFQFAHLGGHFFKVRL